MKILVALVLTLLVAIPVYTVNNNLQKEAGADQMQPSALSFFSTLFGNEKLQNKDIDNTPNSRTIFKGLQTLNQLRQNPNSFLRSENKGKEADDQIPYEALLPRRRMPLDLKLENAQKLFQPLDDNRPANPLEELISELTKQRNENNQDFNWQNPVFKDKQNGEQLPFFNIFGKRRQRKNHDRVIITQAEIESLLIQKIPTLEGGKIVKMTSNHYKKGLFLNIEFQDKQNKILSIIARYRPRKHLLEVVSVKSNSLFGKIDPKPVAQENKPVEPMQSKVSQSAKKQQDLKYLAQQLKKMQELNKQLQSQINNKQSVDSKKESAPVKAPQATADKKQQAKPVEQKKVEKSGQISKEAPQATQQKAKESEKVAETPKQKSIQKAVQKVNNLATEQKQKTGGQASQKNILNQ